MSLEKMNDKMMREYLRDHRIDIGKPEYEEGGFFGRFTLFFRDETLSFRNSLSDLYENCIASAAYSGTGPHYEITGVHGSRSSFDGMYSRMEEAQKLFLSVFREDQRQYCNRILSNIQLMSVISCIYNLKSDYRIVIRDYYVNEKMTSDLKRVGAGASQSTFDRLKKRAIRQLTDDYNLYITTNENILNMLSSLEKTTEDYKNYINEQLMF